MKTWKWSIISLYIMKYRIVSQPLKNGASDSVSIIIILGHTKSITCFPDFHPPNDEDTLKVTRWDNNATQCIFLFL